MRKIKRNINRLPKWKLRALILVDGVYSFTVFVHENIGILPFDDMTNFYVKIGIGAVMTITNIILLSSGKKNVKNDETTL